MRKLTDSEIKNLIDVIHKGLNLCGTSIDYDALNALMCEFHELRIENDRLERIKNTNSSATWNTTTTTKHLHARPETHHHVHHHYAKCECKQELKP